jgi:hypothetical protein
MVFHMKTTLIIDDGILQRLKQESARQRTTISHLVESALRMFLGRKAEKSTPPVLPTFDGGGALVDVADREELYRVMEKR